MHKKEFYQIARPIITHEAYLEMRNIPHHHGTVFDHCLGTAYVSYKIAKKLKLDHVAITRGCLLHDFYLYKFKKTSGLSLLKDAFCHTKNHPKIALQNALQHFELNAKERNIITGHMFPMGLPKTREAFVVSFVDKGLAIAEYFGRLRFFVRSKYRPAHVPA